MTHYLIYKNEEGKVIYVGTNDPKGEKRSLEKKGYKVRVMTKQQFFAAA